MSELSPAELGLFNIVMDHVSNVNNNDSNNMNAKALAVCFAPIILNPKKWDDVTFTDQRQF